MATITEQKKISLLARVSRLPLWKRVLAVVVLIGLLCGLGSVLAVTNRASISLTVAFARGSEGRNPDGSAFRISQIISDEVLADAAEKLGNKVDADTLRDHLTVSDATSGGTLTQIEQDIRQGVTDYTQFPTTYQLTYATVSQTVKEDGFFAVCQAILKQFVQPGKKRILEAVAQSYAEHYQQSYLQQGAALNVDWSAIDELDHYDRVQVVRHALERAERFLLTKYDANANYTDRNAGVGYGDVHYILQQLRGVDVNNYEAFVLQHGLTRDKQSLLRQFRYLQAQYEESYQRNTSKYEVYVEAISMYDADTTKVVFVPALDEENAFYMSRTKVGMDYLVEQANNAKLAADEAQHDAAHCAYLQTCFTGKAMSATLGQGEELYAAIKEKVEPVLKQAEALLEADGNRKGIELGQVDFGFYPVSVAMSCVKPFVFLNLIAFLLWCGYEAVQGRKRNKVKEDDGYVGE